MKHQYIKLATSIATAILLSSCSDLLDVSPQTQLSPQVVFSDYSSFAMYSWGLYDVFGMQDFSFHIRQNEGPLDGDANAYLNVCVTPNDYNPYNKCSFDTNDASGWGNHYSYLRRLNTMLDALDNYNSQYPDVTATEDEKAHWRSVGYFFRAWVYADLLAKYGDVPYITHCLGEEESFQLNKRIPRDEISKATVEELIYARDHISGGNGGTIFDDGANTINRDCVLAMISRFCLQEATTRIYRGTTYTDTAAHPIDRSDELNQYYLTLCVEASEELMKSYPVLAPYFDELYTADKGLYKGSGLKGYPGIILYKAFEKDLAIHNHTKNQMSNSGKYVVDKQIIEMYLCRNGKPITNNPMYKGDDDMFDEFSGRDRRLWMTVVPPYHVNDNKLESNHVHISTPETNLGMLSKGRDYYRSIVPEYNVYIDSIAMISREHMKRLPCTNWGGNIVENMPNLYYAKTPKGKNGTGTIGYVYSNNGYTFWKYVNSWTDTSSARNFNDIPIFHIEEMMLNFAEAKWELGQFDQAVANQTINKLRARENVGTAPMNVGEINAGFDPARDPSVDPVLWEIRRERIVELLGDGFGFGDIVRWGTAKWFVDKEYVGCGVTLTAPTPSNGHSYGLEPGIYLMDGNGGYVIGEAGQTGHIFVAERSVPGWDDKYFLQPITYTDLRLSSELVQNPGYSK